MQKYTRQAEYTSVVGVSLIVRAAIQGGMNPYDAYALNDLYLQRIESAASEEKRDRILLEALFHITDEVRRAKERSMQSIHIQKVRSYIARHINQRLTQREITEYVGLSPAYLSSLFSRTEHISIKEYILREKINAAKNMLTFSDLTISQISYYMSFNSQSHFGQVFKRFNNETPSEYRLRTKSRGI